MDAEITSPTPVRRGTPGRKVLTALAAVSLLGAAGCAGSSDAAEDSGGGADSTATEAAAAPASPSAAAGDPTSAAAPADAPAEASDQTYKDGTYTQVGTYVSPGGPEEIGITLTLESDVVTAAEAEPMPSNPTTEMYQGRFASGIQEEIMGKKLDELEVDKVAGSSLSSGGFAEAAEKIKGEAGA
ncbi:hypothetical protein [Arthrobacter sp. Br18]|uniref:FMN-binding protein n=1 Tax=Arthrobacter sp. Br18 TaxID=1312954 RepID=UPI0004BBBC46|nr:hypothetical protein [Arthrobacter sp. Br18]